MKRWWGTSKREVCRREIRERVRMGERKQRRGMVKKSTDKIDKNWNPRTKYGWESAAARYPKQVVRSRRQGLRQGQRINSPTHLSNTLSRHTHTLRSLCCEANGWKMILCVWCSSSKRSTELQLLLSFTRFAVLPLRMENEPQKALIMVQSSATHTIKKWSLWVQYV